MQKQDICAQCPHDHKESPRRRRDAEKKQDTWVKCPYYHRDGHQSVHCEGVQTGCGLRLGFASNNQLTQYKRDFCRSGWTGCLVAKMLNRKYEYEI